MSEAIVSGDVETGEVTGGLGGIGEFGDGKAGDNCYDGSSEENVTATRVPEFKRSDE
jgi:hypothetical protein